LICWKINVVFFVILVVGIKIRRCCSRSSENVNMKLRNSIKSFLISSSIYQVHDEVKDRMFELELSWVGQRKSNKKKIFINIYIISYLVNDGKHERVPTHIFIDAEKYAKVIKKIFLSFLIISLFTFRLHWKKPMMMTMKCRNLLLIFYCFFVFIPDDLYHHR
jgi:hypothetical protein